VWAHYEEAKKGRWWILILKCANNEESV
jgi:hypothetical protein